MQAFRKAIESASAILVILIIGITPYAGANAHEFRAAKLCGSISKVISLEEFTCVEPKMKVAD